MNPGGNAADVNEEKYLREYLNRVQRALLIQEWEEIQERNLMQLKKSLQIISEEDRSDEDELTKSQQGSGAPVFKNGGIGVSGGTVERSVFSDFALQRHRSAQDVSDSQNRVIRRNYLRENGIQKNLGDLQVQNAFYNGSDDYQKASSPLTKEKSDAKFLQRQKLRHVQQKSRKVATTQGNASAKQPVAQEFEDQVLGEIKASISSSQQEGEQMLVILPSEQKIMKFRGSEGAKKFDSVKRLLHKLSTSESKEDKKLMSQLNIQPMKKNKKNKQENLFTDNNQSKKNFGVNENSSQIDQYIEKYQQQKTRKKSQTQQAVKRAGNILQNSNQPDAQRYSPALEQMTQNYYYLPKTVRYAPVSSNNGNTEPSDLTHPPNQHLLNKHFRETKSCNENHTSSMSVMSSAKAETYQAKGHYKSKNHQKIKKMSEIRDRSAEITLEHLTLRDVKILSKQFKQLCEQSQRIIRTQASSQSKNMRINFQSFGDIKYKHNNTQSHSYCLNMSKLDENQSTQSPLYCQTPHERGTTPSAPTIITGSNSQRVFSAPVVAYRSSAKAI